MIELHLLATLVYLNGPNLFTAQNFWQEKKAPEYLNEL